MTMGRYMALSVAFAFAQMDAARSPGGDDKRSLLLAIDHPKCNMGKTDNSSALVQNETVSTHRAVTPAMQDDTGHQLVQSKNLSVLKAGELHSRTSRPTSSAFVEHGQGAQSVLRLHHRGIWNGFFEEEALDVLLWIVICCALFSWCVCFSFFCFAFLADRFAFIADWTDPSPPEWEGLSRGPSSDQGRRFVFPTWLTSWATNRDATGDEASGHEEIDPQSPKVSEIVKKIEQAASEH